jgi:hypothetical protein
VTRIDESAIGLEAYVGEDVLQGEREIPFFIGWNRECAVESIKLALKGFTRLVQLYNVNDAVVETSIKEQRVLGSSLKTNGYLGGLLEPDVQQDPFMKASLGISIHLREGRDVTTTVERTVFSTTVTKVSVPNVLSPPLRSPSIKIEIAGLSTVMINIDTEKDSDVELALPPEIDEAFDELAKDLLEEIDKIRRKYPEFEPFFRRLEKPQGSLPEVMNELRGTMESMKRTPALMEDLGAAITAALMFRIFDRSSILYILYEYFESRAADRAFLTQPLLVAKIPKGESQLSLKIGLKNVLGEDIGRPILTKCKVESREDLHIPLKEIISIRRMGGLRD